MKVFATHLPQPCLALLPSTAFFCLILQHKQHAFFINNFVSMNAPTCDLMAACLHVQCTHVYDG